MSLIVDPSTAESGALRSAGAASTETRVLILAPTGSDAELTAEFLAQAEMHCAICADVESLAAEMRAGCGAIVMAEEALEVDSVRTLADVLGSQPPWSDIPITLITSEGDLAHDALRRLGMFGVTANVTLLERPFGPRTLISTTDVALRARQRQYLLRELIAQARDNAQHLEFVLRAGGLGAWRLEWDKRRLVCSDDGKAHWGMNGANELTDDQITRAIDPLDRARVASEIRRAVETGSDFESEYRIRKDGSVRWIMARGRNA